MNQIYVGHICNINGAGYTATCGEPNENTYCGEFHRTAAEATREAIRMADECGQMEGVTYEIGGPFADKKIVARTRA